MLVQAKLNKNQQFPNLTPNGNLGGEHFSRYKATILWIFSLMKASKNIFFSFSPWVVSYSIFVQVHS